jgi:non-homologous end joining protein Ku
MRAYWKGYLKLSFVSCPIALYPATSAAERLSFRQINRRTGHRLKHKLVDSITGEAVVSSNKARGYEVGENEFLLVEDQVLERARTERPCPGSVELSVPSRRESPPTIPSGPHEQRKEDVAAANDGDEYEEEEAATIPRLQTTRTIEIDHFLPSGQIDARYFEKPYYIVPREDIGQEAFAVIRDAMAREGVIGLARIVLSSRERPFLIEPVGTGLSGVTLRFAHEVRGEADYFSEIPHMKLPTEMMKLAQHIIRTKLEISIGVCWKTTTAVLSCASSSKSGLSGPRMRLPSSRRERMWSTSWTHSGAALPPIAQPNRPRGADYANQRPNAPHTGRGKRIYPVAWMNDPLATELLNVLLFALWSGLKGWPSCCRDACYSALSIDVW